MLFRSLGAIRIFGVNSSLQAARTMLEVAGVALVAIEDSNPDSAMVGQCFVSLQPVIDMMNSSRSRAIVLDLFKSPAHNLSMKSNAIRTSIDLPRDLHRRIHEAAARKGCSARKLILAGIERAVEETKVSRPSRRLSLDQPLIRPAGRRISITNDEAYELIELP